MAKAIAGDFKKTGRDLSVAVRNDAGYRFDLLDPGFLADLATYERNTGQFPTGTTASDMAVAAIQALVDYQNGVQEALIAAADACMMGFAIADSDKLDLPCLEPTQGFVRLYPNFLREMAEIAHHGATKYADFNFTKPGLTGAMSPFNHAMGHLTDFLRNVPNDRGHPMNSHFSHAAFNCMMEYWHVVRGGRPRPDGRFGPEVVVELSPATKKTVAGKLGKKE